MKKLIMVLLVAAMALTVSPAFSQQKDARGASATAMEKADDQAIFHRVSDWFATRGKSPEEAKAIRASRQAERGAQRAQKEAEKQKGAMQREAEKAQRGMKGGR
jgi:hypothetical protein